MGGFPGSGLVSGALSLGGTILQDKASEKEMKQLQQVINSLGEDSTVMRDMLERNLEEMKNQRSSSSEVREDWEKVKEDIMIVFNSIKDENKIITNDIKSIKDVIMHTRIMVEDLKFKVLDIYYSQELYLNVCFLGWL